MISCNPRQPTAPQRLIPGIIRHEQNITAYEEWESDQTHIIVRSIFINHAILKIQPGATVQFENGAAISVLDSAGLVADGSSKPIIFSSRLAEKGAWKYLYFGPGALDDSCKLINCQIEYGGGDDDYGAAIYCDRAAPTIIGCVIENSLSVGVIFNGNCRGFIFENNIISNCGFVPIQTNPVNVSAMGNNIYRDNGLNQIRIVGNQIEFDDRWQHLSVPYRLADGLHISSATLTIDPAVELIIEFDEWITISDQGSLQAIGTPEARIIFTASNIGDWNGIRFTSTADDARSKLIHCVIENGGRDRNHSANLILDSTAPEISNCLIRQSIGYGVYLSGRSHLSMFNNNRVVNNLLAPISVSANRVANLTPGFYWGNGLDVIEVRGGATEPPIVENCYWDNLGLPYQVHGTVQIQSATLLLAPGITLQMAEQSGFEILNYGGLIADGSSALITIEGVLPTPGAWNHILFGSTANANNCQLIHCRIIYGGGDINRPGMICCDNLSPTIRNCMIEYSQTYGIYLTGNAMIADLNSNFFNGNGYGNYFKLP